MPLAPADESIWNELNAAATEYADAKRDFDKARIRFEVAKKRLAVTTQLGSEIMSPLEWTEWIEGHESVRYARMTLGEAIADALRRRAFQAAFVYYKTYEPTVPEMNLEQIVRELKDGGYEFRTLAPHREANAALINAPGVEKLEKDKYRAANFKEIANEAAEVASTT